MGGLHQLELIYINGLATIALSFLSSNKIPLILLISIKEYQLLLWVQRESQDTFNLFLMKLRKIYQMKYNLKPQSYSVLQEAYDLSQKNNNKIF